MTRHGVLLVLAAVLTYGAAAWSPFVQPASARRGSQGALTTRPREAAANPLMLAKKRKKKQQQAPAAGTADAPAQKSDDDEAKPPPAELVTSAPPAAPEPELMSDVLELQEKIARAEEAMVNDVRELQAKIMEAEEAMLGMAQPPPQPALEDLPAAYEQEAMAAMAEQEAAMAMAEDADAAIAQMTFAMEGAMEGAMEEVAAAPSSHHSPVKMTTDKVAQGPIIKEGI